MLDNMIISYQHSVHLALKQHHHQIINIIITMSTPMVTYKANCHCGHVRFSFPHPLLQTSKVVQCNCSICTKNGYLLVYPRAADVVFASGQNDLSAYRFGNKAKPHKFCPYCGTSLLIDFSDSPSEAERVYLGINVCLFNIILLMWFSVLC